jgi:acetyl-CoA carboxylase biotin carboxyl carrier protein
LRIRLKRKEGEPIPAATGAARPVEGSTAEPPPAEAHFHRVPAPLTGVFYTASNPTARPYVEVGDWVEESTVVGLIETMKVFNEVMAECRGRIAAVVAQQGQLVQVSEPVVLVDTAALPDNVGEAAS